MWALESLSAGRSYRLMIEHLSSRGLCFTYLAVSAALRCPYCHCLTPSHLTAGSISIDPSQNLTPNAEVQSRPQMRVQAVWCRFFLRRLVELCSQRANCSRQSSIVPQVASIHCLLELCFQAPEVQAQKEAAELLAFLLSLNNVSYLYP